MRTLLAVAALFGLTGLMLDAFGSHGLKAVNNYELELWRTAVRYQLMHALLIGLFAVLCHIRTSALLYLCGALTVLGILLFSGGMYARVYFQAIGYSKVTPYGGSLLMCAWLCLLVYAFLKPKRQW